MGNVLDTLKERGFVQQTTDEAALRELLDGHVTVYIGFDPSARSLHIGNLVPIMALSHLQRAGHRPIALVGGGTGLIGDPSGKTEMRRMLTSEQIEENLQAQKQQISRYIDFSGGAALMLNNAPWLTMLNYVEFLRDVGRHFSVNRMLATEATKQRLEKGLSFLEFNYQIFQAYDYLVLFQKYGCRLQAGGDDQWGNILAGVDLIRRVEAQVVHALTFPLITTADGKKMGKTEAGAIWLDGEQLSPYDFYQFWVNVDDRDVRKFLAIYTYLPMTEIDELAKLEGSALREAKRRLAFEATSITHGVDEARRAEAAAQAVFGSGTDADLIPTTSVTEAEWQGPVLNLLVQTGLASSKSEGRRLIAQGGASVEGRRVEDEKETLSSEDQGRGQVLLRAGKKKVHRVLLSK